MFNNRVDFGLPLAVVEMLARVGSIASITLLVMLFAGEGLHPSQVAPREWIALFFFPFGIMVGMIVAWWKEGVGAAITVGSLLAFYLVYGYFMKYHISGWAFLVFASPGFLFLLHWLFAGTEERHALS